MTQCFSSLLGNAIKFVPVGSKPCVRVWAEQRAQKVRVWVEDKGIGIPQHIQDRLFGLFERHDTEHPGTGAGLAIVRKMAERMGGKVGVGSELGEGRRFWLELPSAVQDVQQEPALASIP